MTDAVIWRWRWLLEVHATLDRLAVVMRSGGDARLVRSMVAELRRARRDVRALATVDADTAALAALPAVGPPEAAAVALRLRGVSLRAAADGGATTTDRLRGALDRLALLVQVGGPCSVPSPSTHGRDAVVRVEPAAETGGFEDGRSTDCAGDPGERAEGCQPTAWIARTRDVAWTLRYVGLAVAAGRLPAGMRITSLWTAVRRGGGYLRIHCPFDLGAVWTCLRGCGLRLIGPAASP